LECVSTCSSSDCLMMNGDGKDAEWDFMPNAVGI